MSRDALYVEQMQLREDMSGISPKTEMYKRLKARYNELVNKSGGQKIRKNELARLDKIWYTPLTDQRYKGKRPKSTKKNKHKLKGKFVPIHKVKIKEEPKVTVHINHKPLLKPQDRHDLESVINQFL